MGGNVNNGRAYYLARLRRVRPDLAARVDARELSVYRAAVDAGLRSPITTVRVASPETAMRSLCHRFTPAELRAALDAIEGERDATVAEAVAQALKAVDEAREVMDRDRETE